MKHIENIEKLCSIADDPRFGFAQITIDFFQQFEEDYFTYREASDPIERDELGSVQYSISILIEVMDQVKFKKDIDIFQKMYNELEQWRKAIEASNIQRGIPIHKG